MPLPYENSTSGEKALGEIQKILRGFGCSKFGTMSDEEKQEVIVQFEYRGMRVSLPASIRGYAAAWLREHPYTSRMRSTKTEHERKALHRLCQVLGFWRYPDEQFVCLSGNQPKGNACPGKPHRGNP